MTIEKTGRLFLTVTGTMAFTVVLPDMLYNNAPVELLLFIGGLAGVVYGVLGLAKR